MPQAVIVEHLPLQDIDLDIALRQILEGTATETGEQFFQALVKNLASALNTHGAWVTEYFPESRRLRALAFWMGGQWLKDWEMVINGTPCERVINERCFIHIPDNLLDIYGEDPDVRAVGAASYMGMPLLDVDGKILGHLAVLDLRPMPSQPRAQALFQIFAARAAAELRRMRAEAQVHEHERKLHRLVGSAMDAIVELDQHLKINQVNPAAEKVFGASAVALTGQTFTHFLAPDSREKLARLIIDLDTRPEGQRSVWIGGGLRATAHRGESFEAEATLSRFDVEREPFYTLVLRNVNDRLEAERKIESLRNEAEYLREELNEVVGADEIIGRSEALLRVLNDVKEVAGTDATVHAGASLPLRARIDLAGLAPTDVRVEALVGRIGAHGDLEEAQVLTLDRLEQQGTVFMFGRTFAPLTTGRLGFSVRVTPNHYADPLNRPCNAPLKWMA